MSRRRPALTKAVIAALRAMQQDAISIAQNPEDCAQGHADALWRGIAYVDALVAWHEHRRHYLVKRARRPKASR